MLVQVNAETFAIDITKPRALIGRRNYVLENLIADGT